MWCVLYVSRIPGTAFTVSSKGKEIVLCLSDLPCVHKNVTGSIFASKLS